MTPFASQYAPFGRYNRLGRPLVLRAFKIAGRIAAYAIAGIAARLPYNYQQRIDPPFKGFVWIIDSTIAAKWSL